MSNFKGYDLFDNLEDRALRIRNQAVVLANIAQDNSKGQVITPRAAAIILGYFGEVSPNDRHDVKESFTEAMLQRGFVING